MMLRTIAEISSKRLLYGADGISGLMQTAYPTAAWLYKYCTSTCGTIMALSLAILL